MNQASFDGFKVPSTLKQNIGKKLFLNSIDIKSNLLIYGYMSI